MNKLQIVSAISFLIAISAQAQQGLTPTTYLYQCQQDPQLMGVGTELTIDFGKTPSDFVATLTRTAITMPPRTSTQTFDPVHAFDDGSSRGYEGEGFKLTLSGAMIENPQLGWVLPATLETKNGQEGQALFCKQAPLGLPAVTGSN